jgi:hypothetical protein
MPICYAWGYEVYVQGWGADILPNWGRVLGAVPEPFEEGDEGGAGRVPNVAGVFFGGVYHGHLCTEKI